MEYEFDKRITALGKRITNLTNGLQVCQKDYCIWQTDYTQIRQMD